MAGLWELVVAGALSTGGTAVGWALSEFGMARRETAAHRRQKEAATEDRVLAAARATLEVAAAGQTLAHRHALEAAAGQRVDQTQLKAVIEEFNTSYAQLGLIEAEFKLRGPAALISRLAKIQAEANRLLRDIMTMSASRPTQPLLDSCQDAILKLRELTEELLAEHLSSTTE